MLMCKSEVARRFEENMAFRMGNYLSFPATGNGVDNEARSPGNRLDRLQSAHEHAIVLVPARRCD